MNKFKNIAVVFFGLIIPLIFLLSALSNLSSDSLKERIHSPSESVQYFPEMKNNNDYTLYSLLSIEHNLMQTMINKQKLKKGIVFIGFAVISISMMFIVLGFDVKNIDTTNIIASFSSFKFDLKTGSIGVVTLIVGSFMISSIIFVPNVYSGSQVPGYNGLTYYNNNSDVVNKLKNYKIVCSKQSEKKKECFYNKVNQFILKEK